MRRFALLSSMLLMAACVGPRQPFLYNGKPTIRVAKAAMSSGAPEIALNVANSILNTTPNDVPAQLMKADALYAMGQFALSTSAYQEVIKVQSSNAAAHLGLGRIKLSEQDARTAEAEFRTALRSEVTPETVSNLGVSLDLQKRPAEAQAEYRRALAVDPGSTATRVNLARSLLSTGDAAGARTVLQPAVAAQVGLPLSPDVADVQRTIEQQSAGGTPELPSVSPQEALAPTPLYAPRPSSAPSQSTLGPISASPPPARVRRVR